MHSNNLRSIRNILKYNNDSKKSRETASLQKNKKNNDPLEAILFLPHHCDVFCLKVLTFGGK